MLILLRKDHPKYSLTQGFEVSVLNSECPYRKCFDPDVKETFNGLSGHLFHDAHCKGFRFGECPKRLPEPNYIRIVRKNNMVVKWKGIQTKPMTFFVPEDIRNQIDGACNRLRCSRAVVLSFLVDYLTEENFQEWEKKYGDEHEQS